MSRQAFEWSSCAANTRRCNNDELMLAYRLRHRPVIMPPLGERLMLDVRYVVSD